MSTWSVLALGTERGVGLFAAADQVAIGPYRLNINSTGIYLDHPGWKKGVFIPKDKPEELTKILPEIILRPYAVQLS